MVVALSSVIKPSDIILNKLKGLMSLLLSKWQVHINSVNSNR